jgi:hypothetical protein
VVGANPDYGVSPSIIHGLIRRVSSPFSGLAVPWSIAQATHSDTRHTPPPRSSHTHLSLGHPPSRRLPASMVFPSLARPEDTDPVNVPKCICVVYYILGACQLRVRLYLRLLFFTVLFFTLLCLSFICCVVYCVLVAKRVSPPTTPLLRICSAFWGTLHPWIASWVSENTAHIFYPLAAAWLLSIRDDGLLELFAATEHPVSA